MRFSILLIILLFSLGCLETNNGEFNSELAGKYYYSTISNVGLFEYTLLLNPDGSCFFRSESTNTETNSKIQDDTINCSFSKSKKQNQIIVDFRFDEENQSQIFQILGNKTGLTYVDAKLNFSRQ